MGLINLIPLFLCNVEVNETHHLKCISLYFEVIYGLRIILAK